MRTTAVTIAETTRALVVGISNYDHLDHLPSPSQDAKRLESALIDPHGIAVPASQVVGIAVDRLEREALIHALESIVRETTERDVTFLYFAGHGIRNGDDFFLCTSESDPNRLQETALSSSELNRVLRPFRGRGLLVVLDCCRGAAFAQLAPEVFQALGTSEFKLLLSSTREDQRSWEAPDGSGTLFTMIFTRVLRGEEVPGVKPGLIYLSELFEHLRQRMAEELQLSRRLPQQDPLYAGAVTRDPLLFVHSRLTLQQVGVQTLRYSRSFIVRLLRRIAITVAIVLFLLAGGLYTYLDHSRFIQSTSTGLVVYRGDPRFRLLGYPYVEWELDIPTEATKQDSPLRHNRPVRFWRGEPLASVLDPELRPEVLALVSHWQGRDAASHQSLVGLLSSPELDKSEYEGAMAGLFESLADGKDIEILKRLAKSPRRDVRLPALRSLTKFDPSSAIALVRSKLDADGRLNVDSREDHDTVLRSLTKPCNAAKTSYISSVLLNTYLSPLHLRAFMAAIETTCPLSINALVQSTLTVNTLEDTSSAVYAEATNQERELESVLLKGLDCGTDPFCNRGIAWPQITNDLLTIAAMPHSTCDARLWPYLNDKYRFNPDYVRWAAAAALIKHCDPHQVAARASQDLRVKAELASAQLLSDKDLLAALAKAKAPDIWTKIADAIPTRLAKSAAPVLERTAQDHSANPEVRRRAVSTLHRLHLPSQFAETLFYDEMTYIQQEAYSWRAEDQPGMVAANLLNRFNDASAAPYIPQLFLSLPLTRTQWTTLEAKVTGSSMEQKNAVAVIEMRGTLDKAVALLDHPDREIRNQASQYAGYREDLAQVRDKLLHRKPEFPSPALIAMDNQARLREAVTRDVKALPCSGVSQYLNQLHAEEELPGLRLWLETNASVMKRCALN